LWLLAHSKNDLAPCAVGFQVADSVGGLRQRVSVATDFTLSASISSFATIREALRRVSHRAAAGALNVPADSETPAAVRRERSR
jgi:hypothetical protein